MQENVNTAEPAQYVLVERQGHAGLITLNRPKALNALSLGMVRALKTALEDFSQDSGVQVVAIRGTNKLGKPGSAESLFGGFCAGGDIRYFHQAALAGDNALGDFFTEEYRLNHLIHLYPKPFVAFMDGVVMGGGMGISQGASLRLVTEHTRMAMPETIIGLFPDVGGGYFLSRCPGHIGEYLALTGEVIAAQQALQYGLADVQIEATQQAALWAALGEQTFANRAQVEEWLALHVGPQNTELIKPDAHIDDFFSLLRVKHIVDALEKAKDDRWAQKTAALLRKRSPLMLHVTLEQIRRARQMSLTDDLRMERDMVHHCFHDRPGTASETVEGIRALAVDKDYAPKWNPARIEDVKPGMADAFFVSPWAAQLHPLRDL
ncbi:MAG: enoyl-CoA hydratase/isomerase family protein [Rhodoferax sp.]|nr:enoyl-CoA hydratase/isomerase family protein [Rhodoferax sp.]